MKFLSALLLVAAGRATAKNLHTTEHRKLPAVKCLKAVMGPSNGEPYPEAAGEVTVCFDGTTGMLVMDVDGLRNNIDDGGVHIHTGTSCESKPSQGGHYFKEDDTGRDGDGDPWYLEDSDIAPTGTGYSTDNRGTGTADFEFDQGWGYGPTKGRVVVIHDSFKRGYARVACGVLEATEDV